MIHVNAHPKRMVFREYRAKLGRNPLWQENRNPGPDSKKLDMLNRAQPRQQLVDLVVRKNERVASAQKHVPHFRVLFEITKRLFEVSVKFLFADSAHDATPCAIAAIRGAAVRHQK